MDRLPQMVVTESFQALLVMYKPSNRRCNHRRESDEKRNEAQKVASAETIQTINSRLWKRVHGTMPKKTSCNPKQMVN